ncbi:zinc finger BED domain-containing protein 5-like [Ornithodoros turicata]|uniref:zinc finger BED domain-containing protein 5-like n=1 Tax=Ornithodoros turicata TaxID=34597 RepID=UPI003138D4B8
MSRNCKAYPAQMTPLAEGSVKWHRIREQVTERVKNAEKFATAVDENCDITDGPHLMVFVRYIDSGKIAEEFLCCIELKVGTTGKDFFYAIDDFFQHHEISWNSCTAVCTDRARAMTRNMKGFLGLVKQANSAVVFTHCKVCREALASKSMRAPLMNVLDHVVKVVNSIKSRPKAVHLFRAPNTFGKESVVHGGTTH